MQHGKLKFSVAQLCPTLYSPVDCSLPGSSVHGISQAKILKRVAISYSRDLPNPEIEPAPLVSPVLAGIFFTTELPGKPEPMLVTFKFFVQLLHLSQLSQTQRELGPSSGSSFDSRKCHLIFYLDQQNFVSSVKLFALLSLMCSLQQHL